VLPEGEYGALIFDCDGTLADSAAIHYRAWEVAFAAAGSVLPLSWYLARTGVPGAELIRQFQETFRVALDPARVAELQSQHILKRLERLQLGN
jgi:beta-phosphoglucomutase-like phosphatase (HAD superfamily)